MLEKPCRVTQTLERILLIWVVALFGIALVITNDGGKNGIENLFQQRQESKGDSR